MLLRGAGCLQPKGVPTLHWCWVLLLHGAGKLHPKTVPNPRMQDWVPCGAGWRQPKGAALGLICPRGFLRLVLFQSHWGWQRAPSPSAPHPHSHHTPPAHPAGARPCPGPVTKSSPVSPTQGPSLLLTPLQFLLNHLNTSKPLHKLCWSGLPLAVNSWKNSWKSCKCFLPFFSLTSRVGVNWGSCRLYRSLCCVC